MKALLLNMSPKRNGATQEILSIISAQLPPDTAAQSVCLGDLDIRYCLGDKACYDDCICIHNDDVIKLIDMIDDSDILVIAAPSYWADVPGQFKVFIDRCTPYSNTNPNPARRQLAPGKRCYAAALRTGSNPVECEHIIATVAHWCGHMGIEMAGSLCLCSINDKADIALRKDEIAAAAGEWFRAASK